MSKNKVIKSVSFNITNAEDAAILKSIKRRNFSGLVKKLLIEYLNNRNQETAQNEPSQAIQEPKKLTAAEKMEQMREQMKKAGITGPKKVN